MTEFGAPTGGPAFAGHPDHVTEALQAKILSDAFAESGRYPWAGPLFWYSYKDLGTSNATIENFFGLIRFDGSQKTAYSILQELLDH
jgi:hypothetical protein